MLALQGPPHDDFDFNFIETIGNIALRQDNRQEFPAFSSQFIEFFLRDITTLHYNVFPFLHAPGV